MQKPFKFQEGVLNPSISADGPLTMIISDMLIAQLYLIYCDTWATSRPSVSCKSNFWNLKKCQVIRMPNQPKYKSKHGTSSCLRAHSTLILQAGDYVFLSTQRSVFPLLTFTKPSSFVHLLCVNRVKKSYISKPIHLLDSLVICVLL